VKKRSNFFLICLGAVHKRPPQSEGFVQCGHFADKEEGGFFRCGRPHFLAQKASDFYKFIVCPHGQGELSQCVHFADKEEGSIFCDFVLTFLWTALYADKTILNKKTRGLENCED